MKIAITKNEFQLIELLFSTLKQISKVKIYSYIFEEYRTYYDKVTSLIDVYDSTNIDNTIDLQAPLHISEKKYDEYLRYETIYKAIDSIQLRDENYDSYKLYYYLVNQQLENYIFLEDLKEEKKNNLKKFFNQTEDEKDKEIKALKDTLENYRKFNKLLGDMKFSDNTPYSEVKEFILKELKEFNK